jgi:biopolymer transport protein TolR
VQIVLKQNGALSIGVKGKGEEAPETAPNRDALVKKLRTIHKTIRTIRC